MPIARVAINVPVDTLFDYSAEYISSSDIGLRVSVPFGKKRVAGIIIDVASDTSIDSKKSNPSSKYLTKLLVYPKSYWIYSRSVVSIIIIRSAW